MLQKLLILIIIAVACPGLAEEAENVWITRFERSYGMEGLYVFEIAPDDAAAYSRRNLYNLNLAWIKFQELRPGTPFSPEALEEEALMPEMLPRSPQEKYFFDEETGLVSSTMGGAYSLEAGAQLLLQSNAVLRRNLIRPNHFVRQRWKKLYDDPEVPQWLKREIETREFYMKSYYAKEVRDIEFIYDQLEEIGVAAKYYAEKMELREGDTLTMLQLMDSGLVDHLRGYPPNTKYQIFRAGQLPFARRGNVKYELNDGKAQEARARISEEQYANFPDYPPAMALYARFKEPNEAIAILNKAIEKWPEVPALRIERLYHLALAGRFDEWPEDLDFLLESYPSAPILFNIEQASEAAVEKLDPEAYAVMVTVLADTRPDLLHHQISAMKTNLETGRDEVAYRIWERLVSLNPGWKQVLPLSALSAKSEADSPKLRP